LGAVKNENLNLNSLFLSPRHAALNNLALTKKKFRKLFLDDLFSARQTSSEMQPNFSELPPPPTIWAHSQELLDVDDKTEDDIDELVGHALDQAESTRHHTRRGKHRKSNCATFKRDPELLENDAEVLPWLNDNEFHQKQRVSRESFAELITSTKDDPVFAPKRG